VSRDTDLFGVIGRPCTGSFTMDLWISWRQNGKELFVNILNRRCHCKHKELRSRIRHWPT